jgi:hypothetical protein
VHFGAFRESPELSAVSAAVDAAVELTNCTLSSSTDPTLLAGEGSQVRCSGVTFRSSATFGVLASGAATVYLDGCRVADCSAGGVLVGDNAHAHIALCDIRKNGQAGIQVRGNGRAHIERVTVAENDSGLLARGEAAVTVSGSELSQVACVGGAVVRSVSNNLGGIVAQDYGFVSSERDTLTGRTVAAVRNGRVESKGATVRDVDGCGFLCRSGSELIVADAKVHGVSGCGFAVGEGARLEMRLCSVAKSRGPGLVADGGGCAVKCTFVECGAVGAEFNGLFDVEECEFSRNGGAGAVFRNCSGIECRNCVFDGNKGPGADVAACAVAFTKCAFRSNLIGIRGSDGAELKADECQIEGGSTGIAAFGGTLKIVRGGIGKCSELGVGVFGGGRASFEGLTIKDVGGYGIEVKGGEVTLSGCSVTVSVSGVGIAAVDESRVKCAKCKIVSSSVRPPCDIGGNAKLELEECDISGSGRGLGLQAHDGGTLDMNRSKLHGGWKFGIVVGEKGICQGSNSVVTECETGGVYVKEGGKAHFSESQFEKNGQLGICLDGGEIDLKDCGVRDHASCGILVQQPGILKESSTKYGNNGANDVLRK